jgi:DNA-directed RNA polymerase subunit K/omega
MLRITSNGHKSVVYRKYINGKLKPITIGPFPDLSIEQARKKLQQIKGQIAMGANPLEKKEKQGKEKIFGEAYEEYMERHVKVKCKLIAQSDIERRFKKVLAL